VKLKRSKMKNYIKIYYIRTCVAICPSGNSTYTGSVSCTKCERFIRHGCDEGGLFVLCKKAMYPKKISESMCKAMTDTFMCGKFADVVSEGSLPIRIPDLTLLLNGHNERNTIEHERLIGSLHGVLVTCTFKLNWSGWAANEKSSSGVVKGAFNIEVAKHKIVISKTFDISTNDGGETWIIKDIHEYDYDASEEAWPIPEGKK